MDYRVNSRWSLWSGGWPPAQPRPERASSPEDASSQWPEPLRRPAARWCDIGSRARTGSLHRLAWGVPDRRRETSRSLRRSPWSPFPDSPGWHYPAVTWSRAPASIPAGRRSENRHSSPPPSPPPPPSGRREEPGYRRLPEPYWGPSLPRKPASWHGSPSAPGEPSARSHALPPLIPPSRLFVAERFQKGQAGLSGGSGRLRKTFLHILRDFLYSIRLSMLQSMHNRSAIPRWSYRAWGRRIVRLSHKLFSRVAAFSRWAEEYAERKTLWEPVIHPRIGSQASRATPPRRSVVAAGFQSIVGSFSSEKMSTRGKRLSSIFPPTAAGWPHWRRSSSASLWSCRSFFKTNNGPCASTRRWCDG